MIILVTAMFVGFGLAIGPAIRHDQDQAISVTGKAKK